MNGSPSNKRDVSQRVMKTLWERFKNVFWILLPGENCPECGCRFDPRGNEVPQKETPKGKTFICPYCRSSVFIETVWYFG